MTKKTESFYSSLAVVWSIWAFVYAAGWVAPSFSHLLASALGLAMWIALYEVTFGKRRP